jgi:hypothetical protein
MKKFKQIREYVYGKPHPGKMDIGTHMRLQQIKGGMVRIEKGPNGKTLKKADAKPFLKKGWKLDTKYFKGMKLPKDYYKGLEEEVQGKQLVHHGQLTKHFDMCPSALKAFDDNQKAGMGDKEGFHDAVVAVDKYLGIEKRLIAKGSASETEMKMMMDAVNDAKQKISAAGLPGHTYHQIHIDAVKRLM